MTRKQEAGLDFLVAFIRLNTSLSLAAAVAGQTKPSLMAAAVVVAVAAIVLLFPERHLVVERPRNRHSLFLLEQATQ